MRLWRGRNIHFSDVCVCDAVWFSLYPLWSVITPNLVESSLQKHRVIHLLWDMSYFISPTANEPYISIRRRSWVERDKPKTDRWRVKFELKTLIIQSSLIFSSTAIHAEDTPERKANMLTQFPWIPSEVLLAVCCQTNSMILSLFLILVFPSFIFFPLTLWQTETLVAVICCFVYVSSNLA